MDAKREAAICTARNANIRTSEGEGGRFEDNDHEPTVTCRTTTCRTTSSLYLHPQTQTQIQTQAKTHTNLNKEYDHILRIPIADFNVDDVLGEVRLFGLELALLPGGKQLLVSWPAGYIQLWDLFPSSSSSSSSSSPLSSSRSSKKASSSRSKNQEPPKSKPSPSPSKFEPKSEPKLLWLYPDYPDGPSEDRPLLVDVCHYEMQEDGDVVLVVMNELLQGELLGTR